MRQFPPPNSNSFADKASWVASSSTIAPIAVAIDPVTNSRVPVIMVEDEGEEERGGSRVVVKKMKSGGIYAVPISANPQKGKGKVDSKVNKELLQHSRKIAGGKRAKRRPKLKPATSSSSPFTPMACTPKSQNYPSCLVGHSIPVELDASGTGTVSGEKNKLAGANDVDTFTSAMQLQQFHDLYHTLQKEQRQEQSGSRKKSFLRIFLGILSSWLPPVVALVFVVSFELGRRKRLQHLKVDSLEKTLSSDNISTSGEEGKSDEQHPGAVQSDKQIGSITLSSTILGYGCHGTVVFLGSLHNRKVAVKRMLSAYDSSAANEIDLLCRTDDHANLIRYFMRETDGGKSAVRVKHSKNRL